MMMEFFNKIVAYILVVLDRLLPALNLSEGFIQAFDAFITFLIGLLGTASWFIPLNSFVMCITAILIVDGFGFGMRIGQIILKLIRG